MESEAEGAPPGIEDRRLPRPRTRPIWAGLRPGMRVADLGCGPGRTTAVLHEMAQPAGETVGIDFSLARIEYAREHYSRPGLRFQCRDIREPLADLGHFDFVWVRFVLEYYQAGSFDLIRNFIDLLAPGGILCLIDLDCNGLNHHEMPDRLATTINELMLDPAGKSRFRSLCRPQTLFLSLRPWFRGDPSGSNRPPCDLRGTAGKRRL